MPFQTVAQRECIGQLVIRNSVVSHLGLRFEIGIKRQQRVIDHVAVIAHDMSGRDDRIENTQARMRYGHHCCGRGIRSKARNTG